MEKIFAFELFIYCFLENQDINFILENQNIENNNIDTENNIEIFFNNDDKLNNIENN